MNVTLQKACDGKPKSQGGMNIPEIKQQLINIFNVTEKEINKNAYRKDLENYCKELLKKQGRIPPLKSKKIHINKISTSVKKEIKIPVRKPSQQTKKPSQQTKKPSQQI